MYRIHFEAKTGCFVIQIMYFGMFWVTVRKDIGTEILEFKKFQDAIDHVQNIGLDKLYSDRSANQYAAYVRAV